MRERPHTPETIEPLPDDAAEALDVPRRPTAARLALQLLGLVISVGLLVWAVRLSLSEENARSIDAMRSAPAAEVALLIALSLISLALNGLMFWVTLRPEHRLRITDTILTNSIATFLSILPFKISLIARVLIHKRRDHVHLTLLIAWVAAMGALGLAVLTPLVVASLWRGRLDPLWWATVVVGIASGAVAAVVLGRLAQSRRWLATLSLGSYRIVRHPEAVVAHHGLRIADAVVLAARFLAGAMIVDADMPLDRAVLLSTTYFLLSVVTPAGTLGVREMGVAALGLSQGMDEKQIALIALIVTGAEVIASGALALVGAVRLRLDRLLLSEPAKRSPLHTSVQTDG